MKRQSKSPSTNRGLPTVLSFSVELRRTGRKVPVVEENVLLLESQGMFTGNDYRAIQGNQLLNHAGQTVRALGGSREWMWEQVITGRLLGRQGGVRGDSPSPHLLCPLFILVSTTFQDPFSHLPELDSLTPIQLLFSSLPFLMTAFLLTSSKSQMCAVFLHSCLLH